ncbi:MAG: hypothetical protein JSS93_05430 [Bacteroidetes bacterium]|nr:hypothetical protein [Bacteroidota bacterium]
MGGLHEDVFRYFNLAQENYSFELTEYSKGVLIPLQVQYAQALVGVGKKDEAWETAMSIDPLMFDDNTQQYYRMHYHKMIAAISKRDSPDFRNSIFEYRRIARQHKFRFFENDWG